MKKILILKDEISAYNVDVYNIIAEHYDLTVGYYTKDKSKSDCKFKKVQLNYTKIGGIFFIQRLRKLCNEFDLVSFVPNMHVLCYCLLPFLPHKYKLVNWSIGFKVSYIHPYLTSRPHNFQDKIFQCILDRCDASIFYMEEAKKFWKKTSLNLEKVFVAPNTAVVNKISLNPSLKKDFLFVGTLYKGKGLDLLIESYKEAISLDHDDSPNLIIVGDGEMRPFLESFIKNNNLENKIQLRGSIFDESILAEEFKKALLCISPTQGGLSAPKSMGYGVPFVTRKDAITGGEIYHINSGINGIMYDKDSDLTSILKDAISSPQKYIKMGENAYHYYYSKATVRHMVQGALDAFAYAFSK